MKEYEISDELRLNKEQENMLMMHSFINIMSVLTTELQLFEQCFPQKGPIRKVINEAFERSERFSQPVSGQDHATDLLAFQDRILRVIDDTLTTSPTEAPLEKNQSLVDNIRNILCVLNMHARDVIARNGEPEKWVRLNCQKIREDIITFLRAIEKNSKGRYRIVYDVVEHEPEAYLVHLHISGTSGKHIRVPSVFIDVMRDIIANARKYTLPGGIISAALTDDGEKINLVVEDNGRGIPEDEIQSIVRFSVRASNVGPNETQGAGFGLTKAYCITRQFGGRMWIRSGPGEGTRISIRIPRPANTSIFN